jgi:hypothetical protein
MGTGAEAAESDMNLLAVLMRIVRDRQAAMCYNIRRMII